MKSLFAFYAICSMCLTVSFGKAAFEKLTDYDFPGTTYYTIRNLTLWECQGWCREEPECAAASYSFVLNPLAPIQETLCLLQNETLGINPSAQPQPSVQTYYSIKLDIRADICVRPWTFERVPNKAIQGLDSALIFTNNKEACLSACLNERKFVCRSCEYNYVTLQCQLSKYDRRSVAEDVKFIDIQGIDYFENLCIQPSQSCQHEREFEEPKLGISSDKIARYIDLYHYVDKELMSNNAPACKRACEIEKDFLCRSFLYKGPPSGKNYNCQLFHLDHYMLPDGPSTFLSLDRPLLDSGERTGTYYENVCRARNLPIGGGSSSGISSSTAGEVQTSLTDASDGGQDTGVPETNTKVPEGELSTPYSADDVSRDPTCDSSGTCYDVSVHCKDTRIIVHVQTTKAFNGRVYALGRSETCNIDIIESDDFRLDLTMAGQDCNTQSINGVYTNTVVIQHHSVVMTKTDRIYKVRCTYDMTSKNITFGMMPIRDPAMIPITSAPEAPPPRIRILDATLKEVETVRIGDRLTFRIEIPEETPYGIFARSCVAMAKDSRSTFQIIDDDGCPVEPAIFPHFVQSGSALQAIYEAFRFTESYGVIFQCNVKYCLGECTPKKCRFGATPIYSFGRKKRALNGFSPRQARKIHGANKNDASVATKDLADDEISITQEILVLDFGDQQSMDHYKKEKASVQENFFSNSTVNFDTDPINLLDSCPTRSSVLALAVTCAILLLIYLLTVFYFIMRQRVSPKRI